MSGHTQRRAPRAARATIALFAAAALAAACGSDDPVTPDPTDDEELPVPADSVGETGDPYAAGVNARTVEVDGYPREFLVYVPPGHAFSEESPAPVVLWEFFRALRRASRR